MDMPVNVPIDNPEADTEWNDILRKHGIIPEKPKDPDPIIQEALLEAQKRAHENRLEDKNLDELSELEDDEDEDFLEQYRQRRLMELSALQKTSVHGQVYPLQKVDYSKDVTEASSKTFVFVNLTSANASNIESELLSNMWRQIATRFGELKFCEIRGNMCIEGYPERNCPTILVYKDGEIRRQIVTLAQLRGAKTGLQDLESMLIEVGAISGNDSRIGEGASHYQSPPGASRHTAKLKRQDEGDDADDDDDWD